MGITWLSYKSSSLCPTRSKSAHSLPEPPLTRSEMSRMSNYDPRVQEYIRACEALLKIGELSDAECLVVEKMMDRLSDELLNDGKP